MVGRMVARTTVNARMVVEMAEQMVGRMVEQLGPCMTPYPSLGI
jgi:hypothetical protein